MQRIPNRPKNANAKTASSSTKIPLSAISFWPALTERLESTPARPTWSLMSAPVSAPGRPMLDAPTAFAKRVRSFNHYINHFKQIFYSLFYFFLGSSWWWIQVPIGEAVEPWRQCGSSSALRSPGRLPKVLHLLERHHPQGTRLWTRWSLQRWQQTVWLARERSRMVTQF